MVDVGYDGRHKVTSLGATDYKGSKQTDARSQEGPQPRNHVKERKFERAGDVQVGEEKIQEDTELLLSTGRVVHSRWSRHIPKAPSSLRNECMCDNIILTCRRAF